MSQKKKKKKGKGRRMVYPSAGPQEKGFYNTSSSLFSKEHMQDGVHREFRDAHDITRQMRATTGHSSMWKLQTRKGREEIL